MSQLGRTLRSGALALLATLLLCELAARAVFPLPEILNFNRVQFTPLWAFGGLDEVAKTGGNPSDAVSYEPQKPLRNVRIEWSSDPDGVAAPVTLNLFGFRGDTFPIEKPAGRERVLFFGDSFVEGVGAQDDETIPVAFEAALAERNLEVINLGVAGIELPAVAQLATVAIPLLQPDHVVVVVYHNDLPAPPLYHAGLPTRWAPLYPSPLVPRIAQAIYSLATGHTPALRYHRGPFPFFRPVPHPSNPLTSSDERFRHLPAEVLEAMRAGRLNPFLPDVAVRLEERLLLPLDDQSNGRSQLAYLQDLCEREAASLLVGFIPSNAIVSDAYRPYWEALGASFEHPSLTVPAFDAQAAALASGLRDLGVPFVDLTPPLREAEAKGERLYAEYDTHLRAAGYELVGQTLARRFARLFPE